MISVERIAQYTKVPQEAPPIIEKYRPPPNWPDKGEIIFDNICMRYRPNLELVLKGVSFKVNPGEFIGIVGRTVSNLLGERMIMFRDLVNLLFSKYYLEWWNLKWVQSLLME